ncbi:MAG: methylamine utilization protein [Methylococcales bacterium]
MKYSWYVVVAVVLGTGLSCLFADASAELLNVTVTDSSGNPVNNAVVSAYSRSTASHSPSVPDKTVIIDQVDKKFVNHVTPVQVGTAISFPNHDQIRHHVYSFSPAKSFEIPLYKGIPAEPITFKQKGIVTLGCNIHDWMSAYIVVVDSPYFATTNEQGHTSLTLPVGDYQLRFWHRDADETTKNSKQPITIQPEEITSIPVEFNLTPSSFSGRSPVSIFNRGRYR